MSLSIAKCPHKRGGLSWWWPGHKMGFTVYPFLAYDIRKCQWNLQCVKSDGVLVVFPSLWSSLSSISSSSSIISRTRVLIQTDTFVAIICIRKNRLRIISHRFLLTRICNVNTILSIGLDKKIKGFQYIAACLLLQLCLSKRTIKLFVPQLGLIFPFTWQFSCLEEESLSMQVFSQKGQTICRSNTANISLQMTIHRAYLKCCTQIYYKPLRTWGGRQLGM